MRVKDVAGAQWRQPGVRLGVRDQTMLTPAHLGFLKTLMYMCAVALGPGEVQAGQAIAPPV
eukprot:11233680-Karenia_brevis.AAC.1